METIVYEHKYGNVEVPFRKRLPKGCRVVKQDGYKNTGYKYAVFNSEGGMICLSTSKNIKAAKSDALKNINSKLSQLVLIYGSIKEVPTDIISKAYNGIYTFNC